VQLANLLPRLHAAGADLAAVVVDPPTRNAAMAVRWKLPFPIWSDPGGERFLRPLDLWNGEERGGIGWPALVVFEPAGDEVWRFRSRDFADRSPDNADLLAVLDGLALPSLEPPSPWSPEVEPVEDPGALRPEAYGPMFSGIRFATIGLAGRLETEADRAEARRMSAMAQGFLGAWKERRAPTGSR
jgi:hypothetical protein